MNTKMAHAEESVRKNVELYVRKGKYILRNYNLQKWYHELFREISLSTSQFNN